LKKRPASFSLIGKLLASVVFLSIVSFTTYMGVIAFDRSSKNIEDLSYVRGEVTGREMSKYKRVGMYETTVEDVLVLSIEGSNEKFGFLQSSHAFQELLGFHSVGKSFEIYYDPLGERIQDNITLHTYDLKVGQAKIIDINESKNEERILCIFFFALTLFLVAIPIIVISESRKKLKRLRSSKQIKGTNTEF